MATLATVAIIAVMHGEIEQRLRIAEMAEAKPERPPRVMHIVNGLASASVEAWLMRMLRHAVENEVRIDWTFYCISTDRGVLDEEAEALGARVLHSPAPLGSKRAFLRALRAELRRGRYTVLHSHHDLISAVYLLAAWGLPIEQRIVHVHNADESVLTPSVLKQAVFRPTFRWLCLAWADQIVANSNHSLDVFLAGRKRRIARDLVHYLGIDTQPFTQIEAYPLAFRRQLGLPEDARIVLFAGRMVPEKNPVFAVDVVAEMRRTDPRVAGVFVGAGSLEQATKQRAATLGIEDSTRFLGWRSDVHRIMASSDWFILPHPEYPMEGFGIAVVEAQLAGLRLLLSNGVGDDPLLPTACMRRLSLQQKPGDWAVAAFELERQSMVSRADVLRVFQSSPMAMDHALSDLVGLHARGKLIARSRSRG